MTETSVSGKTRLQEALDHVEMGFKVLGTWGTDPDGTCLCPKRASCPHPGKHPLHAKGFLEATDDPDLIEKWLTQGPAHNYGIVWPAGGEIVVILDVDGPDWVDRITDLKVKYGPLPPTKTTRTPSGGLHLFYRWPKGVPVPPGNELHGFVARFPWKGYVIGPGSAINGKVYTMAGPREMATLPVEWAQGEAAPTSAAPGVTITIGGGYELPASVPVGGRHDAIVRFVASRWNKGITKTEIEGAVRSALVPLFTEAISEARLKDEIDGAWETAERKWHDPGSGVAGFTATGEVREATEVDLLEAEAPVMPPPMRGEAYATSSVIAGLINHFDPRTDGSFEGLALTSLVYLGALMGHTPCVFYGSREQHTALFSMLVGTTGVSRKGTTVDLVSRALMQCTEGVRELKQSPNSGEGLIALAANKKGDPMVVVEEEFDRFLTAKGREGSTLSSILRQAFDDISLTSATATKVVRSDYHHIAMLGNVTREEITEKMARVDLKNGFANRILWTAVAQRPVVATVFDNTVGASLRDEIRDVIRWTAGMSKPMAGGLTHFLTPPARDLLSDAGVKYGAGVGMAPFLSRRLDTIAARLALVYACFWKQREVEVDHVEAALAVTDYAYESARWVFPETTGDARADLVLRHLRVKGFINYTELEALIGKRALDRQQVFDLLGLMGYARLSTRPRRDGRPGAPQKGIELI